MKLSRSTIRKYYVGEPSTTLPERSIQVRNSEIVKAGTRNTGTKDTWEVTGREKELRAHKNRKST